MLALRPYGRITRQLSCLAGKLDVQSIAWAKPRKTITDILGSQNQSLPVLVPAEGTQLNMATKTFEGVRFIDDKDDILNAMRLLYDIPAAHP